MNKPTILVTMIALFNLFACSTAPITSINKQPTTPVVTATQSDAIQNLQLKEGQTVFLADKRLNVTFKQVINDNRCPSNVQCIWAGNASVAIEVLTTTSRPVTLKLSIGDLRGDLVNVATFANYKFALKNLTYTSDVKDNQDKPFANIELTITPVESPK